MRIDILSTLPRMVEEAFREGVVGRAMKRGLLELKVWNLRDFAEGKYQQTDDAPFGGGAGMVMKPDPIFKAVQAIRADGVPEPLKILLTPQGRLFDQKTAVRFSKIPRLLCICGRYEGVDERVSELCVDEEISIGDYVLSGGEIPAMVVMDAVGRLIPGVLGNDDSPLKTASRMVCLIIPTIPGRRSLRESACRRCFCPAIMRPFGFGGDTRRSKERGKDEENSWIEPNGAMKICVCWNLSGTRRNRGIGERLPRADPLPGAEP